MQKLFLGSGAMKAGTTWLYKALSDHQELFFTPEKEIHFLSDYYRGTDYLSAENRFQKAQSIISGLTPERAQRFYLMAWYGQYNDPSKMDFDWYEQLFRWNRRNAWNVDFSNVSCLLNRESWVDLKSRVDQLRVIYVVRNPLERLWSHTKFHHKFIGCDVDFRAWSVGQFEEFLGKDHVQQNIPYVNNINTCLLYTSPSPRDQRGSRMPSSA